MRLSINHKTGFRYASRVKSSYNEARMTPATTEHQTVWTSRVTIEPAAWSFTYSDYWGTVVTTFELHEPHEELTVHAQAVVETRGDEILADSADGPATVSPIAVALADADVRVRALTLREPTLDDVFLTLTGQHLEGEAA